MVNDVFVDEKVATAPEHSGFEWVTDASDLGLRVGGVPRAIPTSLGNKQPFLLTRVSEDSFFYRQQFGCLTLRVFND